MDINTLRVMAVMYGLRISEEEYKEVEEAVSMKTTGRINCFMKKGYLIYVEKDNSDQIYIKKTQEVKTPSATLCKILFTFKPPQEVYVLHKFLEYRSGDTGIKKIANNLEDAKIALIDRFMDEYRKEIETEEQMKAIYWLFGQECVPINREYRKNMHTILKVFEKENRRTALVKMHAIVEIGGGMFGCRHTEDREYIYVKTYTPKDKEYNYVDEGREFKEDVWIADDMLGKITSTEIDVLISYFRDTFTVVTANIYAQYQAMLNTAILKARRAEKEGQITRAITTKAEAEFQAKGEATRSGIRFTNKGIYRGVY
jgi:hypothetical protein